MAGKGKKNTSEKASPKLEDLKPARDPKGGQTSSTKPRALPRHSGGGWDANHNPTSRRALRSQMAGKRKKEAPKKTSPKLEDLKPTRDPKGGGQASQAPPDTLPRGGWDGNHNPTSIRTLRRARR